MAVLRATTGVRLPALSTTWIPAPVTPTLAPFVAPPAPAPDPVRAAPVEPPRPPAPPPPPPPAPWVPPPAPPSLSNYTGAPPAPVVVVPPPSTVVVAAPPPAVAPPPPAAVSASASSAASLADTMVRVCDDLDAYRRQAIARVAGNSLFGGGSGALANLNQYADLISRLRPTGVEGRRVLANDPAYSWDRWQRNARDIRNGIASTIGDTSAWGLSGFLSGVVGQTGSDVAELGRNALPEAVSLTKWLVVGAVAVAAVYALNLAGGLRKVLA